MSSKSQNTKAVIFLGLVMFIAIFLIVAAMFAPTSGLPTEGREMLTQEIQTRFDESSNMFSPFSWRDHFSFEITASEKGDASVLAPSWSGKIEDIWCVTVDFTMTEEGIRYRGRDFSAYNRFWTVRKTNDLWEVYHSDSEEFQKLGCSIR